MEVIVLIIISVAMAERSYKAYKEDEKGLFVTMGLTAFVCFVFAFAYLTHLK